jgi:DNA-binding transcriptional LysR family regulator
LETLANLESFIRSAEFGSFSEAARRLGLTPAAVSRNVAMLERGLGVRLLQRSTRRLSLTEAGETLLAGARDHVEGLKAAVDAVVGERNEPSGILRVSMSQTIGTSYILPLLPAFAVLYPALRFDWRLENRQVDLIGEGVDAAIGGGFALPPGVVARSIAPRTDILAVAAPGYMADKPMPREPSELSGFAGIMMRSDRTGRVRDWALAHRDGREQPAVVADTIVLNSPAAICQAAVDGLGIALVAMPDAFEHLASGRLVNVLPNWRADAGPISIYYASRTLLPAKTRAFVDFILEVARRDNWARRFALDS